MEAIKKMSHIFILTGLFFLVIGRLTSQFINWPDFIANNLYYITGGLMIIGIIFKFIFLWHTKDYVSIKRNILSLSILVAIFFLFYFIK